MKKILIITTLLLMYGIDLSAKERIDTFELVVPVTLTVWNSLYDNIEFQDSRPDSEYDRIKIDGQLFADRLNTILRMATDNSADTGSLFFELANLDFEETDSNLQSHIRINLYEKINEDFYLFNSLDSTLFIPMPSSLYKETVSNLIANFVTENLTQGLTHFSAKTSSSEKDNIKLYSTDQYTDGIYSTFEEFADQTPSEYKITPKFKKEELKEIKIIDTQNNKLKKVNPKDIYAVVVDGRPYIATDKRFIPLYKEDNEFYFEDNRSKNRLSFSPSFSIGVGSGGYSGGGLGIGIFSQPDKRKVLFMINHEDGSFMDVSNN